LAKRVVSWSSLDWDRGRWNQLDLVFGTVFDVGVHAMNSVLLAPFVSSTQALIFALVLDGILTALVLFNPKLAWANPDNIPNWVRKRLSPLSPDQRQENKTLEELSRKLSAKQVDFEKK
jgi:hypothetical protein